MKQKQQGQSNQKNQPVSRQNSEPPPQSAGSEAAVQSPGFINSVDQLPKHPTTHSIRRALILQMQRQQGNSLVARQVGRSHGAATNNRGSRPNRSGESSPRQGLHTEHTVIQRTPEEDFLNDLQSGVDKASEYLDYITRTVEYWQRYGGDKPGRLNDAAQNLLKITTRLKSGMDRFRGAIGRAQQLLQLRNWLNGLETFANRTNELDITNAESVEAWAGALREQIQLSQPLIDSLQGWLRGLARRGSAVAGRASFVLSVFTAYLEVGAAALQAGVRVERAYIERRHRIIEEGFREARGQRPRRPPPPSYPGDWHTAEEQRQRARARQEYMRRVREQREEQQRRQRAIQEFNEQHFPRIYLRNRSRIRRRILRDMRSGRRRWRLERPGLRGHAIVPGHGARIWWDCLTNTGGADYFDQRAGIYVTPTKARVNAREAEDEIYNFQHLSSGVRCPYFDELYNQQLERHLQTALSEQPASSSR